MDQTRPATLNDTQTSNPPPRSSIGLKLPLIVIGLMLFAFFIYAFISIRISQGALVNNLSKDLQAQTANTTALIRTRLTEARTITINLATAVESGRYGERELTRIIQNTVIRNDQIFGATIGYEPNQFKVNTYYWSPYYNRTPENSLTFTQLGDFDYFNQEWYFLPKRTLTPTLSPPYRNRNRGNIWMVTWGVPFFDQNGNFKGVAATDVDFTNIQETFQNLVLGNRGYAFLINSDGTILGIGEGGGDFTPMVDSMFAAANSRVTINWLELTSSMTAEETGFMQATDVNGAPMYIAFAPVGLDTGWSLALAYPREEIQQQTSRLQGSLLAASLLLSILFGVIIYFFTGSITTPLRQLTQAANKISAEDPENIKDQLGNPIQIQTQDELEDLAGAFNKMAINLKSSLEGLEEKVAERTWELENSRIQSERRAAELQSISEISKVITAEQKLDILLPLITRLVSDRFDFYHVGIFLLDESKKFAALQAANSEGGKVMLAQGHKLEVGESGIVGYVANTKTPRIALDVGVDSVFFNNPHLPETRSEMALPLVVRNSILGVMDLQSKKPGAFTETELNTMSILADQIAISIENARFFEQTQNALTELESLYRRNIQEGWLAFSREESSAGYHQSAVGGKRLSTPINSEEIRQAMNRGELLVFHADGKTQEASLVVPIKLRGQVIGVMHIKAPTKDRQWTSSEINLTETISERLSLALENARLIQESQRQVIKEQTISEITGRIGSSINLENVLLNAVEELGHTIPGSEVVIKLKKDNPNGNEG